MLSIQELRSSTHKELQIELENARRERLRVRIGTKTKHIKDTSLASKYSHYIARIVTVMNEVRQQPPVEAQAPTKKDVKGVSATKKTD